jgi:hypothetical protein
MKTPSLLSRLAAVSALLMTSASAQVAWEAYNDHRTGATTAATTTLIEMRGAGTTGFLKNFATGDDLPVTMTVEEEGGPTDDFGANAVPNSGSPADLFFTGKCTIGGAAPEDGIPGIKNSLATVLRLRFSNLDPLKRYKFRGTCCRGNPAYTDRWTVFKMVEADGATAAHNNAHVDGVPDELFTTSTFPGGEILADEVALNSGDNLPGCIVGWDDINPGADGTFAIEGRQYLGPTPAGFFGTGPYGYGFNVMYLAEVSSGGGGVGTITNVSKEGGDLKIEWTGPGTLQQSIDLSTWLNITGATSPYTFPTTPNRQFFRLHE